MNKHFCYIHIPFCELKCNYCRFASIWLSQEFQIDIYVKNLIKEIEKSPFKKEILDSIYFWWWTPSVLNKNQLNSIFLALNNKYDFNNNIEITLESTPNNVTKQNIKSWYELWINRISIWVQTLNKKSLKKINRGNKWDIIKALENLEKYSNIKNISLDFIIWLPYVKPWEILEDIKYILWKYDFIKHISVYMLEEYYNPDKIIETKYDNITYPDDWDKLWIREEDYLWEYRDIKKYLTKVGFNNYEISNYWKIWYECKHNIWYWEHDEVYGFWLWAYSFVKWIRYSNSDNFKDYYLWKKLLINKLNKNDIFLEKVMFWLRTSWLEKILYEKLNTKKIYYFLENWYLKKESDKLILTDSWVLVMDYILSEII